MSFYLILFYRAINNLMSTASCEASKLGSQRHQPDRQSEKGQPQRDRQPPNQLHQWTSVVAGLHKERRQEGANKEE